MKTWQIRTIIAVLFLIGYATIRVTDKDVDSDLDLKPTEEQSIEPTETFSNLATEETMDATNNDNTQSAENINVSLETSMGTIKLEIFTKTMPITGGNFKKLVEEGFYDGIIFHRIIDGFMIQGGDPTGTGTGGSDTIKDEFTDNNKNDRGTIAMANAGPNTGSSQFFINLVDNNFLDSKHPVFGKVVDGMDVVDAMAKVKTGAMDKPVEDVTINKASIL